VPLQRSRGLRAGHSAARRRRWPCRRWRPCTRGPRRRGGRPGRHPRRPAGRGGGGRCVFAHFVPASSPVCKFRAITRRGERPTHHRPNLTDTTGRLPTKRKRRPGLWGPVVAPGCRADGCRTGRLGCRARRLGCRDCAVALGLPGLPTGPQTGKTSRMSLRK
jgi:hypothetical protein